MYDEVDTSTWSAAEKKALIATKWVMVQKTPESVRARLAYKGFKDQIDDKGTVFAATPNFSTLMVLHSRACDRFSVSLHGHQHRIPARASAT